MKIACVLKTGGEYDSAHVIRLMAMCAEYMPEFEFVCLTDKPILGVDAPILGDWPGWWAKMNLFDPRIPDDLLYFDLDVTLLGRPSFADQAPKEFMMLRAFEDLGLRWPWARNSSVMLIPQSCKREIWNKWNSNPEKWMDNYPRGDDFYLAREAKSEAIQDEFPDECVSYKYRVTQLNEITEDNKVIVFHGHPRPWAPEAEKEMARLTRTSAH